MKTENYFNTAKKSNRPRILFTIGIPGSGKSFYTSSAKDNGWVIISSDSLRVNRLKSMQLKNEKLNIDAQMQVADPNNSKHVFHQSMRDWVNAEVEKQLRDEFAAEHNIIFDITNVSLQRVRYLNLARKYNYYTEAFVFNPNKDLSVHLNNVERRVLQGGLDLATGSENQTEQRMRVIRDVNQVFNCFSESLREDVKFFNYNENLEFDFDWKKLKKVSADFNSFLNSLTPEEQTKLRALAQEDVFNEIHYFEVEKH